MIDFPDASTMTSRSELVRLLTHIGHLSSTAHHAVNTNQLLTGAATLPFHPTALYRPVPSTKGVEDIVPFLPPKEKALGMTELAAVFARPLLAGTNRTLVHMFDNSTMLAAMNDKTREANAKFVKTMIARSAVVKSRTFDADGLSQGMPFVWKALDPDVAPWSATV
jgi:ABC-type transporter Mla subunit MlaD